MRYVVTGRVQPERADIYFYPIIWQIPNDGKVAISCDSSQITIVLELTSIDGWATAFIVAEDFAMLVVGALGFSSGSGYSVDLIQVTEENGFPHVFGVRPTNGLSRETLGFPADKLVFDRAARLACQNYFFRWALRDFTRAIKDPYDCATYCYRSIESIKSAFAFKSGRDGWKEMHAALATDRTEIESSVKKYADPVRHGNWVSAPFTNGSIRWTMLLATREILWKYLDYEMPIEPAS